MDGRRTRTTARHAPHGTAQQCCFKMLRAACLALLSTACCCLGASFELMEDQDPLQLPPVGAYQLRLLTPTTLELTLITTKSPGAANSGLWDFINGNGQCRLPAPEQFNATVSNHSAPVKAIGFKRRVLYAPLKQRDLRIANYLYLQLAEAVGDNQSVQVSNPDKKIWPPTLQFKITAAPQRWSPVLHVNQTGYLLSSPKKAMVGYYLGSLGELDIQANAIGAATSDSNSVPGFQIVEASSGRQVFQGNLVLRPDHGFPFPCYQKVLEADFSALKTPGQYRLFVPGLGCSFPFFIDDAVA